jgi:hypothetical protein
VGKRSRIDVNRVAQAALEAALSPEHEQQPRKKPLRGLTAVAAGAALVTAARVAVKKAPALLPNAPRISDMTDGLHGLRDRLAEHGWIEDEEPPLDDFGEDEADDEDEAFGEDEADDDFDEDDDDGEPVDEADWDDAEDEDEDEEDEDDEGDDDEADDDGPDASADEEDWDDEDDEPEEEPEDEPAPSIELGTNGGGREASARRTPDLMRSLSAHRRPPVMRSGERALDPAEQPPEPPKRKQRSTKQRSSKSKSKAGGKS